MKVRLSQRSLLVLKKLFLHLVPDNSRYLHIKVVFKKHVLTSNASVKVVYVFNPHLNNIEVVSQNHKLRKKALMIGV